MIKIIITQAVNTAKLMDELLAENLIRTVNEDGTSTVRNGFVFVEKEENAERVQQIIHAHDPTPLPPPITETERIAIAEQAINDLMMIIKMGGM